MEISLTEQMVFNAPPEMEGWRFYRIEYGGCNEDCIWEGSIWLPQHTDAGIVEILLRGAEAYEKSREWL